MQNTSRQDAIAQGLDRYFTGRPCKHGHIKQRRTACSTCVACWALASERMRRRNGSRPRVHKFSPAEKRAMSNQRVRKWIERHPDGYAEMRRQMNVSRMEKYHSDIRFREEQKSEARLRARRYDKTEINRRRREAYANGSTTQIEANDRRRAKKHGVDADFSASDYRRLRTEAGGICAYCLERRRLTLDHVEPISKGGPHIPANAVMACQSCNTSKKDRPLLIFLMQRFG